MTHDFLSRIRADLSDPGRTRLLNRQLFTLVAPRYDLATRCLSLGRDAAWKNRLVASLPERPTPVCLDLACGTGDLSRRLVEKYPAGTIIGLDLTEAMLAQARQQAPSPGVHYRVGDMGHTGLADNSVDIVTGGYALRNAGDLQEALQEVFRVLKPGGIAVFLDFSKPPHPRLQRLCHTLLKLWGGAWGWVLHRDARVYAYIADSLARYPDRRQLAALFNKSGFRNLRTRHAFAGLIECLSAEKPR
ncbi:MAG: ubiquinone/menaquinone biosynthesis methyltransferase [bacterium]